jgi:hypothetical protein
MKSANCQLAGTAHVSQYVASCSKKFAMTAEVSRTHFGVFDRVGA